MTIFYVAIEFTAVKSWKYICRWDVKHCIGICEITKVETLNISLRSDFLVNISCVDFRQNANL